MLTNTTTTTDTEQLVSTDEGLVDASIFVQDALYQAEMARVFQRCWLFLNHESAIPHPGDYLTTSMGEDAVILCRDATGRIRVFLNRCRHRGNQVCLFDRGTARAFTCTYHGWTYNTQGTLTGVPFSDECYLGELDRQTWGLVEVPRVESLGGLVFGCWDPAALPLRTYLGDMTWYLETYVTVEYLGGLEIVPGRQRYLMPANWKLLSDNFAGDHYHFPATHASFLRAYRELAQEGRSPKATRGNLVGPDYEVTPGYNSGPPHAVGQLRPGTEAYEDDLRRAAEIGPEAVDWVRWRFERLQEQLRDYPVKPYSLNRCHIFPNFSQIGLSSVFEGRGFIVWQPKGPHQTEAVQWCAVEKEAPRSVKEHAVWDLVHGQAAAGLIGPDDHENFERLTDNIQGAVSQRWPFNYQMALGREESYPGRDTWAIDGLPGYVGFHTTEISQRQFYRYWRELMQREGEEEGDSPPHGSCSG